MADERTTEREREAADEARRARADEEERFGGGRFNKRILFGVVAASMICGVAVISGIHASAPAPAASTPKPSDDGDAAARAHGEIEELAANGAEPHAAPSFAPPGFIAPKEATPAQAPIRRAPARAPGRYAQWAEEKYLKALEAPQMVSAFHNGATLEIAGGKGQGGATSGAIATGQATAPDENAITLHPPASPYTVMAGSVLPAVLVSGVDSDLPGPIVAQASENIFDSATGKYLLIPQGSRLIGAYGSASAYGQQRVQIAWRRLIFPNASSMDLPQMPGADQDGYAGFTDEVNHHYLGAFGAAAVISLISAGQMVGQMATFGGGAGYGPYGYYQPNQWALAGQTAGSAVSGQFGSVGQQMIGNGVNRPPTIEIRPGYRFNLMVTEDLVFPGAYKG
jgi:type IV secretory pathway VirB10-like protein